VRVLERVSDRRAGRVNQRSHERRTQLAITGAIGEQRPDHPGRHPAKSSHEHLQALVEIAQRAPAVRRARLPNPLAERCEHEPLTTWPPSADRRLRRPRPPRDVLEGEAAVARLVERRERGTEHGGVDLSVPRTARARAAGPVALAGIHTFDTSHIRYGPGRNVIQAHASKTATSRNPSGSAWFGSSFALPPIVIHEGAGPVKPG
jgi:hypothetical protein